MASETSTTQAEAAVAEAEKMAGAMITEITDETEKNIRNSDCDSYQRRHSGV
jgi:hypothetical protein